MMKDNRKQGKVGLGLVAMGAIIGTGGMITVALNAALPLIAGVAIVVACASANCNPAIFDPTARVANAFSGDVGIQEAILDQEGWSWASKAKRLRHNRFEEFNWMISRQSNTARVQL